MFEATAWVMTVISIIGTILNIKKKKVCFILWTITNIFWIVYDIHKGAYPQALVFVVYTILAIYGLIEWAKHDKKEKQK